MIRAKPIPGMSLTEQPKSRPYLRPPKYPEPEDALQMYLDKLSEKKMMSNLTKLMEKGVDIKTITTGILRLGVANGLHSIDTSMIISPIIHEKIKGISDLAGLEYNSGFEKDNSNERDQMDMFRKSLTRSAPKENLQEPELEIEIEEKPTKSLIQRRTK